MLGPLASLASSFTWAIGSSAYSPLSKKYSGLTVNICRALMALPLFFLLITLSGHWSDFSVLSLREVLWLATGMVASYCSGDALFLFSSQSLGVPGALAITSCYPIWSALAGSLFLGQSLKIPSLLALLMAVGGVVLVVLSDVRKEKISKDQGNHLFGLFAALLTSLLWSLNTYANSQVRPEISSAVANSIRMGVALVVCPVFIFLLQKRGRRHFTVERKDWKRLGWVFGFEGAGGAFFFVYGLTHSPLAVASALSSLAPAIAVPIALLSRRESLSKTKVIGVLFAVLGVIWLVTVSR